MNCLRMLALVSAVGVLVGCSGSKDARGPVKGRVTLNGKALPGVTVVFDSKALGVSQTAATDDDGKYEFAAYNATGLPAGSYRVAITPGRFLEAGEEVVKIEVGKGPVTASKKAPNKAAPSSVPEKYRKPESSGLTAEVKANDNGPFDFDLKP